MIGIQRYDSDKRPYLLAFAQQPIATTSSHSHGHRTMCQQTISGPYPCGHDTVQWKYCGKAKTASVIKLTKTLVPCKTIETERVPADLTSPCSSTCLTRPFQCHRCRDVSNQVTWQCKTCKHLRCGECKYWSTCQYDGCGHIVFGRIALGTAGALFCDICRRWALWERRKGR